MGKWRYKWRRFWNKPFDIDDMIYFCDMVMGYKIQVTARFLDSRFVEEDVRIYYQEKKEFLEAIKNKEDIDQQTINNIERHLNLLMSAAQENETIVSALQLIFELFEEFNSNLREISNGQINVVNRLNQIREHHLMTQYFFVDGPG